MPPHARQGGSASPARTRASTRSVGARSPHVRHATSRSVPWISMTRAGDEPAIRWRPSTFWVISVWSVPRRSRAASARCPALGLACHAGDSSRLRQAHARTAKIALAEARALRGVVAAWSAADLPETARPMPSAYGAVRKGRPWSQPILARDRVRYVGEPVAVVVAESPYRVADALELVRVEYEPLPARTTVEAALRLGRPVKWIETRREDFASLGHDREQTHEARIGFARDGTIVAIDDRFLADVGAYPAQGDGLTANTVNHLPGPYRVPHYRNAGTSVVTNKALNAAYRAAGRPEAVFVMERLMDLGARRLGLDPAERRQRNLVRPDEVPYPPGLTYKDGVPIAYDPGDFPRAFERALALLRYAEWRSRQKTQAGTSRRLGLGLACYAQGTGLGPYEGATVRVDPSGKVYVLIGVAAQGQGHATTLAQIAASEPGAAFDDGIV